MVCRGFRRDRAFSVDPDGSGAMHSHMELWDWERIREMSWQQSRASKRNAQLHSDVVWVEANRCEAQTAASLSKSASCAGTHHIVYILLYFIQITNRVWMLSLWRVYVHDLWLFYFLQFNASVFSRSMQSTVTLFCINVKLGSHRNELKVPAHC